MREPLPPRKRLARIARSLVAAALLAVLAGFVSLLVAIGTLLIAGFVGARPDMTMAYREIAAMVALAVFPAAFVAYLAWEPKGRQGERTHTRAA